MTTDRRALLKYGIASLAALETLKSTAQVREPAGAPADQPIAIDPNSGYARIGCEAAWTRLFHL